MKHLITGGAGFLGSHLIDNLMKQGESVICLDNFSSGSFKNIAHWSKNKRFKLINHNVIEPFFFKADRVWHLACPASPFNYQINPIETLKTIFIGTINTLELARKYNARILVASTSSSFDAIDVSAVVQSNFKELAKPEGAELSCVMVNAPLEVISSLNLSTVK